MRNAKAVGCPVGAEGRGAAPVRAVRMLREELQLLQEPGSYVGEVVKVMSKTKVLCKVHPEGKYVVDLDKVRMPPPPPPRLALL